MVPVPLPPELPGLSVWDIIVVVLLVVAALDGARRGMIRGGMLVAGVLGACYLAGRYYPTLATAISDDPARRPEASLVAYLALLVFGLAMATTATSILYTLASRPPLVVLDRMAGAVLGLLEGTLLIGLVLLALSYSEIDVLPDLAGRSWLATAILACTRELIARLPPEIGALARIAEEAWRG